MPAEIDHITLTPDKFGWKLTIVRVLPAVTVKEEYLVGDAIQFHGETERTLGKWLADGPEDFHNPTPADLIGEDIAGVLADAADTFRDMERGK